MENNPQNGGYMKTVVNWNSNENDSINSSLQKSNTNQEKIFAYCGYKLEGKKLVAAGTYNPIPYEGL
jgi:hypothetical protein